MTFFHDHSKCSQNHQVIKACRFLVVMCRFLRKGRVGWGWFQVGYCLIINIKGRQLWSIMPSNKFNRKNNRYWGLRACWVHIRPSICSPSNHSPFTGFNPNFNQSSDLSVFIKFAIMEFSIFSVCVTRFYPDRPDPSFSTCIYSTRHKTFYSFSYNWIVCLHCILTPFQTRSLK